MLRPYQQQLFDRLRTSLRVHDRVLGVLPTGGGKTRIFTEIAKAARAGGHTVQILVHRRELVEQTPDDNVTTIQSWTPGSESLVIVDEAHHSCARTWKEKLLQCPKVLGFTATPERLDGGGLDVVFDDMVIGADAGELLRLGYLSSYKTFCPPGQADTKGIRKSGGDYARKPLGDACSQQKVVAAAVNNWRLLAGGRQTIGFCVSVAHMESVQDQFVRSGIECASIEGRMSKTQRDNIVGQFRNGEIKVLLSVDLISEGFDVPNCDCVLLLRPTHSLGLHLQQVGRALRPSAQHAVILDCAGNSAIHGTPELPRSWSLQGRTKERKGLVADIPVRVCPQCYGVHRPALRTCPYCGFNHPLDSRIPEEADIILQELESKKNEMRRAVGRARSVEDLEAIAKERGYKAGWVDAVLRSRSVRRY
ncbi:MAG: DEAD/DEAH box helicase [Synechococcus sp.]